MKPQPINLAELSPEVASDTHPIQSYLRSLPYWESLQPGANRKEFYKSVTEFSKSFDSLYLGMMQYVSLITDKKSMMCMPNDDQNQRLIKHLQKLSYNSYMLAKDVERTTEFIMENGLYDELSNEATSVVQFTNPTQRAFDGVIIVKEN